MRVGAGGVMLPNHPPLIVAEQFGTLEALHPGRIDLGIGRAPGTDPLTARALRQTSDFPSQITELAGYFDGPNTADGHAVHAIPAEGNRPSMWLLGSSDSSGELAGRLGLPYAFAHHIRPENVGPALAAYRDSFQPSAALPAPYVMVATLVLAADTQEHAEWLSSSLGMMVVRLRSGFFQLPHTPAGVAATHPYTDEERALIRERLALRIIGGPDTVRRQLADLLERTQPDELMAMTLIQDREEQFRSYELLGEAMEKLGL
jgi:luciferase family oxidoreductase group 1